MADIHIVGISGSLRQGSRNTAALRWVGDHVPAGTTFEIADIGDLPLYNMDLESGGLPGTVVRLAEEIAAADAVLIASPEYNYSVTGPLKNAIDWLSRPPHLALHGKPVAVFGVAGRSGSLRSQLHLRQILQHEAVHLVERPEVLIPFTGNYDGDEFTGERAQEQLLRLVEALRATVLHRTRQTRRVLVVADDPGSARRIRSLLNEVLVSSVVAAPDDDALTQIESGGFAAIVVDGDHATATVRDMVSGAGEHPPLIETSQEAIVSRLVLAALNG